ncbi:hypothetical protein, partial [Clostridium sp.]|uniref:hypothetical protein n=1 Tax=Clostridium sp. TaxID=1506 RepID=UPI003BB53500
MKDYDKFKEAVQFLQDSLTKINSDAVYKILQNITPENRKEKIMELCLYKINSRGYSWIHDNS